MKSLFFNFFTLVLLAWLLNQCRNSEASEKKNKKPDVSLDKEAIKNQFVRANQQLMQKENDEMDYYAKSHTMAFVRTGSGVRYFVYKPSEKGDSVKPGMQVSLDFVVTLLNGTECYNSKTEGRKTLVIAEEEAESGIHKGLQYLKKGDRAILLIPSPLAHGLLGDFKKIPPQMPIVYDVLVY
jgi:FKBP-type peptidyl-prolyl cis-trans isomerase FkpA